jgi:hypothetical protein
MTMPRAPFGVLVTIGLVVGSSPASAQIGASARAALAQARSALRVGATEEEETGWWYGGAVDLKAGPVAVSGLLLRGNLSPVSGANGFERAGGEASVSLRLAPISVVGVEGSYGIRRFDSPVGFQEWKIIGVGLRAASPLGHRSITGFGGASYLPSVSVSGRQKAQRGLAFEAGVRFEPSRVPFTLGVTYRFERFDFPDGEAVSVEQFDRLTIEAGLHLAR